MPGTIVTTRELGRTFENEVRGTKVARRRWVCTLSDNTLTSSPPGPPGIDAILSATAGSSFGVAHPVHSAFGLRKITVNERFEDNPYQLEVIGEYGVIGASDLLSPTARPAVWSFESGPGEVPALYRYDGDGNGSQLPLTNSAYDFYPGLTTEETVTKIKIEQNFAAVPFGWLSAQNHVNNDGFLGAAQDTVKVVGIEARFTVEEFGNGIIYYYASAANLVYRQSSHKLLLPDIGFNYIEGGQKRRGMVFDFQNSEWVPSPNPIALNGSGMQNLTGEPAILPYRVTPRQNFIPLFGSPPAGT